ncbi:MAG: hypothetical protein WCF24_12360 [Acidimicrobiales bacterium]
MASLGSSTTTTTSPAAASSNTNKATDYLDGVKYAQCMRTYGVTNMPDPNSKGEFLTDRGLLNGQKVDVNSSQYNSANKACTHLLPNGGQLTPAEQQALLAQALKFVQCLRTHGFPNEPDPSTGGGGVSLRLPGRPNSPLVQKAMEACKSFSPGGGP